MKYFLLSLVRVKPISFDIFEWLEIKGRPFCSVLSNVHHEQLEAQASKTSFSQVCRPRSVGNNFRAIWRCKDSGLSIYDVCMVCTSVTVCLCWWFLYRKCQSASSFSTLINKFCVHSIKLTSDFPSTFSFLSVFVALDESASCFTIEKNSPNSALWKLVQRLIYLWVNRTWHGRYKLLRYKKDTESFAKCQAFP